MDERNRVLCMKIRQIFIEKIECGEKNVEARIASPYYLNARIGDTIKFVSGPKILWRKIVDITKYSKFREMLMNEGLKNCVPGCNSVDDGVELYYSFKNYRNMEESHGVISFKLANCDVELPNNSDVNCEAKPKRRYGELVKPKV